MEDLRLSNPPDHTAGSDRLPKDLTTTIVIVVFNTSVVEKNDRTQINQAGIANHGGALDSRPGLHSRHSGNFPGKTQASLYDRQPPRVPAGHEESRAD